MGLTGQATLHIGSPASGLDRNPAAPWMASGATTGEFVSINVETGTEAA